VTPEWVPAHRGTQVFRPRARIIRTLGRDLIQNRVVAVQELVKNSYDADATKVTLTFTGPLTAGQGSLTVSDDGEGMTLDTVQTAWMEPATVFKRRQTKTHGGRRVTGEKGIGRFASARVAHRLELDSVSAETKERVRAWFNWGDFEAEDRYLDQVRCRWEEGPAPRGRQHGTLLVLQDLREDWGEHELRDLRVTLGRLLPPSGPSEDFRIKLIVKQDGLSRLSGPIGPPRFLENPRYRLTGRMEADGTVTAGISYMRKESPLTEGNGRPVRVTITAEGEENHAPRCGPFDFDFRVWDREPEDLDELAKEYGSTIQDVRKDLDAVSGIQVYRDRVRVLMQDPDWLDLNYRRVQKPTVAISSNQIVGHVLIGSDQNAGLVDQSNRQALVDSPELDDFEDSILFLLNRLEHFRRSKRESRDRPGPPKSLIEKFNLTELREYVDRTEHGKDAKLNQLLDSTDKGIKAGLGRIREVVSRYRRLATLGQLVDVLLHDGRTPITVISDSVEIARRKLAEASQRRTIPEIEASLEMIAHQADILNQLMERLAPFSGRPRGRYELADLESVIRKAFAVYQAKIDKEKVKPILPEGKTPIRMDPIDLELLFLNLIDNSLYWLLQVPEAERKIVVEVNRVEGRVQVLFSDSGPGVREEIRDAIFEPWVTDKPNGIGLGLTIAGEAAVEHDAELSLAKDGPLQGATFQVVFRTPEGTSSGSE
jgi:signal transduction histidine kinase